MCFSLSSGASNGTPSGLPIELARARFPISHLTSRTTDRKTAVCERLTLPNESGAENSNEAAEKFQIIVLIHAFTSGASKFGGRTPWDISSERIVRRRGCAAIADRIHRGETNRC